MKSLGFSNSFCGRFRPCIEARHYIFCLFIIPISHVPNSTYPVIPYALFPSLLIPPGVHTVAFCYSLDFAYDQSLVDVFDFFCGHSAINRTGLNNCIF